MIATASAFDTDRAVWLVSLPEEADALWDWCLAQPQQTLLDLLAVSAAHTVDAIREKGTKADAPRLMHADALAKALGFDMRTWFTPTAANFFSRINRNGILEALSEAGCTMRTRSWSKVKKGELAALAGRELEGTGWLPLPLRMHVGEVQDNDALDDVPVSAAA